jgi:hypothetical protein
MPGFFFIIATGRQMLTFSYLMQGKEMAQGKNNAFSYNLLFFPLHFYSKFDMMSPILQGFFVVFTYLVDSGPRLNNITD